MKKLFLIILLLTSVCFGDDYTSDQMPETGYGSTLNVGSLDLFWHYFYGNAFTDGTAYWESNQLYGFINIEGTTLTDGTFIVTDGVITGAIWNGTVIDISDYTNLIAGTNITLSGDTLNVDDAFLINDGDDTTTGTLTAGSFTTAGTALTDILIVGSNAPATDTSTGTTGMVTWDNDYWYVCVATDTWKRVAIASWAVAAENVIFAGENVIFAAEQVVYP